MVFMMTGFCRSVASYSEEKMSNDANAVAKNAYFMNPDMVRFLLIENLALKTLLHEKALITPDEFKKYQKIAEDILNTKVAKQIEEWAKAHPDVMSIFEKINHLPKAS